MKSESISRSTSAIRLKKLMDDATTFPPFCSGCAMARCLAGKLARGLVFLMVNEAARCVEEKVVNSPEDADYGMILGTGFAPFRGGPLRHAEHYGLSKVVDELERLGRNEEKFLPCEILRRHARDGTKFYEN